MRTYVGVGLGVALLLAALLPFRSSSNSSATAHKLATTAPTVTAAMPAPRPGNDFVPPLLVICQDESVSPSREATGVRVAFREPAKLPFEDESLGLPAEPMLLLVGTTAAGAVPSPMPLGTRMPAPMLEMVDGPALAAPATPGVAAPARPSDAAPFPSTQPLSPTVKPPFAGGPDPNGPAGRFPAPSNCGCGCQGSNGPRLGCNQQPVGGCGCGCGLVPHCQGSNGQGWQANCCSPCNDCTPRCHSNCCPVTSCCPTMESCSPCFDCCETLPCRPRFSLFSRLFSWFHRDRGCCGSGFPGCWEEM